MVQKTILVLGKYLNLLGTKLFKTFAAVLQLSREPSTQQNTFPKVFSTHSVVQIMSTFSLLPTLPHHSSSILPPSMPVNRKRGTISRSNCTRQVEARAGMAARMFCCLATEDNNTQVRDEQRKNMMKKSSKSCRRKSMISLQQHNRCT